MSWYRGLGLFGLVIGSILLFQQVTGDTKNLVVGIGAVICIFFGAIGLVAKE